MTKATKPLCDPALRKLLMALKQKAEQIIDTVTQDELLQADFSEAARAAGQGHGGKFSSVSLPSTRTRSRRCRSCTTGRSVCKVIPAVPSR
jgi:hypothetical protein